MTHMDRASDALFDEWIASKTQDTFDEFVERREQAAAAPDDAPVPLRVRPSPPIDVGRPFYKHGSVVQMQIDGHQFTFRATDTWTVEMDGQAYGTTYHMSGCEMPAFFIGLARVHLP